LARSHENTKRNGHVIGCTFFPQISRSHINRYSLAGKLEATFHDGSRYTVITFFNGVVGQADQMITNAGVNMNFYYYLLGISP
jgi:hypothetical protein